MSCDNVPFIVGLGEKNAIELEIVGGKGSNLAILYQGKFHVPDAFIITTSAYQYVLNNEQMKSALLTIDKVDINNTQELENVSNNIKTIIGNITLPNDITDLIIKHYNKLSEKTNNSNIHVAVRSSATAEDLPDNSFAGQQDTYLHVTRETLIEKTKECWASLFTARAISYRKRSNIDHKTVKLAVVVQEMISSEASGVVFTANPLTGLRNEVVINSTYGLGEALVSGLVTPDHYEILMHKNKNPEIRIKNIGEKSIQMIGKIDGGIETLVTKDNDKKLEALSDDYIIQLAKLAKQIEESYNYKPQDIEWGFTKGKFYILQARPITTLFPIPNYDREQSELRAMVSYGTIQGFLDPFTPLGESTIRTLYSDMLRRVGVNQNSTFQGDISSNPSGHNVFKSSANRLWIDCTSGLTSPARKVFGLSYMDTGIGKIIYYLHDSKMFPFKLTLRAVKEFVVLLLLLIPLILRIIRNMIFPRYAKNLFIRQMKKYHQFVDKEFEDSNNDNFTDCVNHFTKIIPALGSFIVKYGGPCLIPSFMSLKILGKLAQDPIDALALTRAVESNSTTEMNVILWKLTLLIRENNIALKLFENETTNNLVNIYKNKLFEENIQSEIDEFFRLYGCRGIGEVDIGRKRWSDSPEIVIEQIKNYLKVADPDKSIDKVHEHSKQSAYEMLHKIENQLKHSRIKRFLLNFFFKRLKILFSLRESPKFDGFVQTTSKCRRHLLHKANLAVQENLISDCDDIFFLYIDELQLLAFDTDHKNHEKINFWKNLISQRRIEYNKQMLCKRIPLALLSNGTTYYDAAIVSDGKNNQIKLPEGEFLGNPVSPGLYEGKVRIVDDPSNSQLEPGEILVCTATDPGWTALFPIVGAIVLEMGGILQHGAIVSREYGLPAVVGVANAKKIFHNGQRLQVNGTTGRVKILPDL